MAQVSFSQIRKVYPGGVVAVENFSMDIARGEFVVLVGPSGCGKSTLLRMVAGLEEITQGEISIAGKVVNKVEPQERDLAMVFQNYALYPHMSVYKNMAFSLKMRKTPKEEIRRRVEEVAEQLEITGLLHRKPGALSGGQCQRVALGRAMVRRPAVFLLDEPLSNLDAKLRAAMRTEIARLHREMGGTFLYVTHDQTEAMTMGTRIVVMRDGLVQQAASPKEVYEHPANLFVAGFMGSPQMNFLPAVVRETADGFSAEIETVTLPLGEGERLERYVDREVTVGIRPEHLLLKDGDDGVGIQAEVLLAELLGAETYLHATVGGRKVVSRVPPADFAPGSQVFFGLDGDKVHLFDKETEQAI